MQDIPEAVLDAALRPYRAKGSVYLKAGKVLPLAYPRFKSFGRFEIAESSYVENTNHFNAAEFIMCSNQLIAGSLAGLLSARHDDRTIPLLWESYFNDCFIAESFCKFKGQISPKAFWGRSVVEGCRSFHGHFYFKTNLEFGDDGDAKKCVGFMKLVMPQEPFR